MHDVLLYAHDRYPSGAFERPAGINAALVCEESGLLAGADCPHTREELFISDTVPQKVCDGKHEASTAALQILFPVRGDVFKYDPRFARRGPAAAF